MAYRSDDMTGTWIESWNNKMGIFVIPLCGDSDEIVDIAHQAYSDWMSGESDAEYIAIGDYVEEKLREKGYKKGEDEDYLLFYNSDWD